MRNGKLHFHVNVASKEYFKEDSIPDELGEISLIEKCIDKLAGRKGKLVIRGNYSIPKPALPQNGLPCVLSETSAKVADEELLINGASVTISGAPYDRLEWKFDGDSVSGVLLATLIGQRHFGTC